MKCRKKLLIMMLLLGLMTHPIPSYAKGIADEPVQGQTAEVDGASAEGSVEADTEKSKSGAGEPTGDIGELENDARDSTGDTGEPKNDGGEPAGDTGEPAQELVRLMLDSENRYSGMDKAYSQGYLPKVENGCAYLVAPILCSGKLKDNRLRVSLNLGATENTPFVFKNYEKDIKLRKVSVNDDSKKVESFVAAFSLELKAERYNGSYPVVLNVKAEDKAGNAAEQEFTVYVTITDGKNPNEEPVTEPPAAEPEAEPPVFAPKVLIQTCQFSESEILAGDEVTADITLVNTSQTERVKNMTVTVNAPSEQFTLLSESDTTYVDAIPAGGTCVISCRYRVNAAALQGQYDLELAMDYADTKGNNYSGSGKAKISVKQPLCMQFDPLAIAPQVTVADVVEAQVSAMNLGRGKVYHVRAVIEADGLSPQGTIFIGDIEPGTQAAGSTQVTVSGLAGGSPYGETEGTVTFYYEDEAGEEQTETGTFRTTIQSPFSENLQEPEDKEGQWWVIMAVIGGMLGIFAALIIVRRVRQRKRYEMVE